MSAAPGRRRPAGAACQRMPTERREVLRASSGATVVRALSSQLSNANRESMQSARIVSVTDVRFRWVEPTRMTAKVVGRDGVVVVVAKVRGDSPLLAP